MTTTQSTLTLHVKKEYFDQIKAGTKTEEYRLNNDYWTNRITFNQRDLFTIRIMCGYPRLSDKEKILEFPWCGYTLKEITHPQFGKDPVTVMAIKLESGGAP
jgi:hypothetical protein